MTFTVILDARPSNEQRYWSLELVLTGFSKLENYVLVHGHLRFGRLAYQNYEGYKLQIEERKL